MKRTFMGVLAIATMVAPMTAIPSYANADVLKIQVGSRYDRDDRNFGDSGRWSDSAHNGYSYKGRWHYGPPPREYVGRRGVEFGYKGWRRGDRLPAYYRSRYAEVDYRRAHLKEPPRGYHYVRDDRGETLLVGIATGAILGVILSH